MWAIASADPQSSVETFIEQYGITFPVLMDTTSEVNQAYAQKMAFATAAYPQDWVIGSDGTIAYYNNGFELEAMKEAIDAELGQ